MAQIKPVVCIIKVRNQFISKFLVRFVGSELIYIRTLAGCNQTGFSKLRRLPNSRNIFANNCNACIEKL